MNRRKNPWYSPKNGWEHAKNSFARDELIFIEMMDAVVHCRDFCVIPYFTQQVYEDEFRSAPQDMALAKSEYICDWCGSDLFCVKTRFVDYPKYFDGSDISLARALSDHKNILECPNRECTVVRRWFDLNCSHGHYDAVTGAGRNSAPMFLERRLKAVKNCSPIIKIRKTFEPHLNGFHYKHTEHVFTTLLAEVLRQDSAARKTNRISPPQEVIEA